jgi:hypothetical protein
MRSEVQLVAGKVSFAKRGLVGDWPEFHAKCSNKCIAQP